MRPSDWTLIRAQSLFCDMSDANFEKLVNAAILQRFALHETLITEGDLPDFLHVVVDGSVELFGIHDGHKTTLDVIRPVTALGLTAVIRDAVYLKSARTLAPAQILTLPAQIVRDVFGSDAFFARAVVNELVERYRGVVRSLKNEKLRTSAERLANWILYTDVQQGLRNQIDLQFDKRVLASRLGMTPENLSRNLSLLGKHGVSSCGRNIVIEDAAALERFAKPNSLIDG